MHLNMGIETISYMIPMGSEEPTPRKKFPIMTLTILAVNLAVFLYEISIPERSLDPFFMTYGAVPILILRGRNLFSLISSMFVHAGIAHIAFNMLYLLVFGDNVEDRLGHAKYLFFYLISGLAATFAQIFFDASSAIPSVGASGAIAGVLSSYILFFPQGNIRALLFIGPFIRISRVPALVFVGFWFMIQFLNGLLSLGVNTAETGGVAYWAHIGGFVAGLFLTIILKNTERSEHQREHLPY